MSLTTDMNNQIIVAVAGIEKLQEGNWWAWKRHITQQFKKLGYTQYLTENELPQPANPEKLTAAKKKDIQKWESEDMDTLLIIMKTISDNKFPHIAGAETTSKAWSQGDHFWISFFLAAVSFSGLAGCG